MPELLDLAQRIAADARPGEQVEAYVSWHRDTDIRAYGGEVESLSSAESSGIGVRVLVGNRQGFAYVGNLDEGLAREALEEARDNAGFATPDEHAGLAVPDGVPVAPLELWDDALGALATEAKVALALDLERRVRAGDARIRQVVSSDYGDALGESAIATSTGIASSSRRTTCYLAADVVAGAGDDTQTGDGYTVGRGPGDLDVEAAVRDAIERSTRLLGARKPHSARLDVVLDRRVTATLLAVLAGTLSGEEVAKGRSLFAGRVGEEVAVPAITLVDDPTNPLAFGAATVDAEGLACRRNALVEAGRLTGFLYDSYSARLAGTRSTGSAVRGGFKSTPGVGARALALVPGTLDQREVVRLVGDGLLVQGISGVHSGVNPVSGDFSVGAEGLMIRAGELAEPVREITIASTIQRMLQHVIAIGADVEWLPSSAAGVSLAVADIAMSGD
ncbi:MAG TPA: TldD/PmbA family protein [Acidimicrobiales bacterium]|nr:TldD/PmbA family protein [Acidimicrobiales bacterium]